MYPMYIRIPFIPHVFNESVTRRTMNDMPVRLWKGGCVRWDLIHLACKVELMPVVEECMPCVGQDWCDGVVVWSVLRGGYVEVGCRCVGGDVLSMGWVDDEMTCVSGGG